MFSLELTEQALKFEASTRSRNLRISTKSKGISGKGHRPFNHQPIPRK
jgi:hypothetical protein